MRSLAIALATATVTGFGAAEARADVSGWAQISGGMSAWQMGDDTELTLSPAMTIDMGAGTTDDDAFIVGGMFRVQPLFGEGVDLALLARLCSRGFQAGPLGFAVDAGPYQRFWGEGSTGVMGQASLGGPLGLTLSGQGMVGTSSARGFAVTLGIDLARLTVHRGDLLDWMPNHRPTKQQESVAAVSF